MAKQAQTLTRDAIQNERKRHFSTSPHSFLFITTNGQASTDTDKRRDTEREKTPFQHVSTQFPVYHNKWPSKRRHWQETRYRTRENAISARLHTVSCLSQQMAKQAQTLTRDAIQYETKRHFSTSPHSFLFITTNGQASADTDKRRDTERDQTPFQHVSTLFPVYHNKWPSKRRHWQETRYRTRPNAISARLHTVSCLSQQMAKQAQTLTRDAVDCWRVVSLIIQKYSM